MITRSDAATLPPPASLLPCLHVVADVDAISTVRRLFSTTDAISPADPSFSDQKLKIACVKRESNEASNSIIRGFNNRIILQIWWMGCFSSRYLLSQGSILSAPLIFRYIPTTHFFETTTLFVANTARFLTRLFGSTTPPIATTVFFGANDAALPGRTSERQYVALEEYKENLRKIGII
ncbi:hypothetical protein LXL04_028460 [Taraxacum kok-saghyz]